MRKFLQWKLEKELIIISLDPTKITKLIYLIVISYTLVRLHKGIQSYSYIYQTSTIYLQVCKHSVIVAASMKYPLHNLQIMCSFRAVTGNLMRFYRDTRIIRFKVLEHRLRAQGQELCLFSLQSGFPNCFTDKKGGQ